MAIDGQIFQDALLEPIGADSEVFLLPAIAGGAGQVLHSDISSRAIAAAG